MKQMWRQADTVLQKFVDCNQGIAQRVDLAWTRDYRGLCNRLISRPSSHDRPITVLPGNRLGPPARADYAHTAPGTYDKRGHSRRKKQSALPAAASGACWCLSLCIHQSWQRSLPLFPFFDPHQCHTAVSASPCGGECRPLFVLSPPFLPGLAQEAESLQCVGWNTLIGTHRPCAGNTSLDVLTHRTYKTWMDLRRTVQTCVYLVAQPVGSLESRDLVVILVQHTLLRTSPTHTTAVIDCAAFRQSRSHHQHICPFHTCSLLTVSTLAHHLFPLCQQRPHHFFSLYTSSSLDEKRHLIRLSLSNLNVRVRFI